MRGKTAALTGFLASFVLMASLPAVAQPPGHAPAHGWRAKNRAPVVHTGYTGAAWELDYGVLSGSCDRQKIGTVVGGITGGLIANRVADGDKRTVATLIGAAAGALIGNQIGRKLDDADEACVGHALELAASGTPVRWTNDATGVSFQLTPGAGRNRGNTRCREFSLLAESNGNRSAEERVACRSAEGVWELIS